MNDIEKGAWAEALQFAFEVLDANPWKPANNLRNYAVENSGKFYPNKEILKHCLTFLEENYPEFNNIPSLNGGKPINDFLATKGANTITLNEPNDEHLKFKNLLAYFVSHLEWVVNQDKEFIGFSSYIEPLISSKRFRKTGQGYADNKIQEQIQNWAIYNVGDIKINIQANFGNYKTVKCYLNWRSSGINIVARWENNTIVSLYQEEYFYMENPTRRVNLGNEIAVEELSLFDKNEINVNLVSFYNSYVESFKKYKAKNKDVNPMKNVAKHIDVLKYKKQIILQGPPGTGKTRLAKQIAQKLIGNNDAIDLSKYLKKGLSIPNASGTDDYYFLEKVTNNGVELSSEKATKKWSASFNKIQEKLLQLQRGESPANKGGDDPYVLAVAKYVYKNIKNSFDSLENNNQFKLVQFHPSYTYEDFVRGIVAKTNDKGDGILYKAENKILAEFAKKALVSSNESVIPKWKAFRDFLDSWDSTSQEKLYFNDDRTIRLLDISYPKEDKAMLRFETWSESTQKWYMQTWISLKDTFSDENYANNFNHVYPSDTITSIYAYFANFVEEKYNTLVSDKFVLIIDEINRANLSSVLGELIYALEYRGEEVESMYEVDGSQKLILPPNLYIIGTMNTADRSVGHIDYAIRRRFAFVEVLPKDLSTEMEAGQFYSNLFTAVKSLFTSDDYQTKSDFISHEFEPKDVALGHSYFIDKSEQGGDEKIRWEYEIKPILIEYVKDGVLKQTALQKISEIEESL